MEYIKAGKEYAERIFGVVQDSIKTVYPKYYPSAVVDMFCELHSLQNITADIINGDVWMLIDGNTVIGTGCFKDCHVTRVYVSPEYQGRGYGSIIMRNLEKQIAKKYAFAELDASLPACVMYERRGYKTVKHESITVNDGAVIVYEIMRKELNISDT